MASGSRPDDTWQHRGQAPDPRAAHRPPADSGDEPVSRPPQQATRSIRPDELGLPALTHQPRTDPEATQVVHDPRRRPEAPMDAESTILLPRQPRGERKAGGLGGALAPSPRPGTAPPRVSDSLDQTTQVFRRPGSVRQTPTPPAGNERTELVTPSAMAAAGAAAETMVGPRGRADHQSTQIIRPPEELPRIDPSLLPDGDGGLVNQTTQLIKRVGAVGQPVFVDSSGKRGRLLKILMQVVGVLTLIFFGFLVVSILGGGPSSMRLFSTTPTKGPSPASAQTASPSPPPRSARASTQPRPAQTTGPTAGTTPSAQPINPGGAPPTTPEEEPRPRQSSPSEPAVTTTPPTTSPDVSESVPVSPIVPPPASLGRRR